MYAPIDDDAAGVDGGLDRWLLGFNVLGALAHLIGVVLTLTQARMNFQLQVFKLVPINYANGGSTKLGHATVAQGYWYPSWIIFCFFSLSLSFHTLVSSALTHRMLRGPSRVSDWYVLGIARCVAFWRWLEYFASASIMIVLTCLLLGVRNLHTVWLCTGLMAITICFGWATELASSLLIEEDAPPYRLRGWVLTRRWTPGSWKLRFQLHVLGYLPYALLWTIVFDQFRMNMEVVDNLVPAFVNTATIGSFCVFTLFGLVQLANQLFEYGPSVYWLGECTYVVLSFAAKAQLGFIVIFQALIEGGVYDAALQVATNS